MNSPLSPENGNPKKPWRDILYSDYSAHFGERKNYARDGQFYLYDQMYPDLLPADCDGPVLDLGCGKGEWLQWMQSRGYHNLTGVDLSQEDLEHARSHGLNTVREDVIAFLQKQSACFSVIHAKDLIEHLDKQEAVTLCAAAFTALAPGGRFILSTFNAQAPFSSATRYGDFTHENGFTPSSLEQLLHACQFSYVDVRGVHICPSGWKGALRHLMYRLVNSLSQFICTLRHGRGSAGHSSCNPDLLACATKSPCS